MRTICNFKETSKKVEFTMGGWDGTGYDGEGKKMNIWTDDNMPDMTFVCKWMPCYQEYCILKIDFNEKHEVSGLPQAYFFNSFPASYMKK